MLALTAFSVAGAAVSLLASRSPSLHFCLGGVLIVCCHAFTLAVLFGLEVCVRGSGFARFRRTKPAHVFFFWCLVTSHCRVQQQKMPKEKKSG